MEPQSTAPPFRVYIVYRHLLFAEGVRSVLESQPAVRIVGMDDDVARATSAIGTEQPDVILLEEPEDRGSTWRFLDAASASRIVTFSLDHAHATVYDQRRTTAADASDLLRALRGEPPLAATTPPPNERLRNRRRDR